MADFSIGLSGLNAVQKALDIVGNNIANAATEGYHRQRTELSPSFFAQQGAVMLGGGVEVKEIRRVIDGLLEQEIYRQQSELGQVSQESNTMRSIENAFGDFSTEDGGLNASIDAFFNSLQDIIANPTNDIQQNQLVSYANIMASQFRSLGEYLSSLEMQIRLESENTIGTINTLSSQIAELNSKIESIKLVNGNANAMCDQRDQYISNLSSLIGVQTIARDNGVVDVTAGGIPLVVGSASIELELGINDNGDLGISVKGGTNYNTDVQGGKLGGLLKLKNNIVAEIHDDLDSLSASIIQQINQYHVQGVGSEGSFTNLTGWSNASENLSDFSNVNAGYTYIRVTKTSDGSVVRTAIPVLQDASSDTLSEIADFINNSVANVTASVNSSNQLTITGDNGYEFDFLPAVLSEPKTADINFNGTSDPDVTVSGIYTGTINDKLTFTVSGTGDVGNDDSLKIIVKDSALNTIATLNIGTGYAAGDKIAIGDTGIKIAISTGDLANGDSFSIDVFGNSDTAGLLSTVGINTFFSGDSAVNMAVSSDIIDDPRRAATSLGAEMNDNANAARMFNLKDKAISELSGLTCGEFYRQLVTNIGQDLSIKQMRQENIEVMVLNLNNQQSEISGVDINDEAAQLLVFEQMFQAIAKYMATVNSTMATIMEII